MYKVTVTLKDDKSSYGYRKELYSADEVGWEHDWLTLWTNPQGPKVACTLINRSEVIKVDWHIQDSVN